ncbi:shikimate dehydrogenase [Candidatus Saganbacteria bacterium]|nr:shikimate dehydrogenase [Candidatus Saganbacteria bacterium]
MKTVGLLGFPLGHTVSPAMHNAAFKSLGINAQYLPFEVSEAELKEAVEGFRALHFLGFNVTIPYKERIMDYLDEATKLPELIGAVNTVVNRDGTLIGYNTDGPGFIESLSEDAGFSPKDKSAVLLGAGGAGRSIAVMLAECGAKSITISDTDYNKAKELADYVSSEFDSKCIAFLPHDIGKKLDKAQLLVNATPIGMHPKVDACPLPKEIKLHKDLLVYDLVYNPQETKLLKLAKAAKARGVSGLGMLVRQGAMAFSMFTDEDAPIDIMWDAAHSQLTKK